MSSSPQSVDTPKVAAIIRTHGKRSIIYILDIENPLEHFKLLELGFYYTSCISFAEAIRPHVQVGTK